MDNELFCCIWLSLCFRPGSDKLDRILHESDPVSFYQTWREGYSFLTPRDRKQIAAVSAMRVEHVIASCNTQNIDLLPITDSRYPETLRQIYCPPPVLYLRGNWDEIFDIPLLTVVGTRQSVSYTESLTGNLCYQLAKTGIGIVSGCAVGIDALAMSGALKAGGRVIGIMSCGVDGTYPLGTKALREAVTKRGVLMSELPPGTGVERRYIPQRNRLLAGLGFGVLVTHAPMKSGALITAHAGADEGKNIYALPPYDLYDANCLGTANLLREGAKPVFSAYDILEDYLQEYPDRFEEHLLEKHQYLLRRRPILAPRKPFGAPKSAPAKKQQASAPDPEQGDLTMQRPQKPAAPKELTPKQLQLYDALEFLPKHAEQLRAETELSAMEILTILTELELMGIVESHPGQKFALSAAER